MKNTSREKVSWLATQRIVEGSSRFGLKRFGRSMFRSKYEHAFAVYLKELKIKFEFEKHGEAIFNQTNTKLHYIPDFYLPEYNVYIEIVNVMNKRLAHKMYDYREQNKYSRLIVLDVKHLREMFDSKFTIFDILDGYKKNTKAKTVLADNTVKE